MRHRLGQLVPGEQFAHGVDELRFRDRELRLGLFLQVLLAVLCIGQLGPKDEVLYLNLAARFLVTPWMTAHGARRLSAYLS